jgi:UTP--glucose-1-phosphate uridylyltransferase
LNGSIGLVTSCKRYDIGDKLGWMKSSIEMSLAREDFANDLRAFMKDLLKD